VYVSSPVRRRQADDVWGRWPATKERDGGDSRGADASRARARTQCMTTSATPLPLRCAPGTPPNTRKLAGGRDTAYVSSPVERRSRATLEGGGPRRRSGTEGAAEARQHANCMTASASVCPFASSVTPPQARRRERHCSLIAWVDGAAIPSRPCRRVVRFQSRRDAPHPDRQRRGAAGDWSQPDLQHQLLRADRPIGIVVARLTNVLLVGGYASSKRAGT